MSETEPERPDRPGAPAEYVGQATYIYSYDVGYDMARRPIERLLGQQATQFQVSTNQRVPREPFFYRPQMVRLPEVQRTGPHGPVTVRRVIKIFASVGAISISIHLPFRVRRIEELNAYHDVLLDGQPLQQEARELANEVLAELRPLLIRPVAEARDEEGYTVFCLDGEALAAQTQAFSAVPWMLAHKRTVAGLLTDDDPNLLSDREVDDTLAHPLSYYRDDLAVIDWDAALIIEKPRDLEEMLHVVELANVQLAEVEAYDRILDDALDRSYRDLIRRPAPRVRQALQSLREIRLDLSRLSDELSNTTKFFGAWHLARIYQRLFVVFHLGDWQRVIEEKLGTVGELYQLLRQDQNNRWMMILEVMIVLLFVIDLVILLIGLK